MTAYRGQPLTTPVDAVVVVLLAKARLGQLVVCAGAGLSVADDAGLPGGRRLGELLDARLAGRLVGYTSPADTANLLDVADAGIAAAGDLLPLQYEVLELADFDQATPNFGHTALALLLAEGAVSNALLWNWDDCVERSAPEGERLQVARTLEDMEQLRVPSIAKIHGCATRVRTLLITSEQLEEPPLWTEEAFTTHLRNSTGVFIGIGDVADYARRRIAQLNEDIPELDIYLVSPGIAARWDDSVWATIVPTLAENRRIAKSADAFLDEVARVWALELIAAVEAVAAPLTGSAAGGIARVLDTLKQRSGSDVIAWCRRASFRKRSGRSVVRSSEAEQAVIALGVLAGEQDADAAVSPDARCRLADTSFEVLVVCETANATDVRGEAQRRAERLAGRGLIDAEATFVVAGPVVGPLEISEAVDLVGGVAETTDVLRGPRGITVRYIAASEVLLRAA